MYNKQKNKNTCVHVYANYVNQSKIQYYFSTYVYANYVKKYRVFEGDFIFVFYFIIFAIFEPIYLQTQGPTGSEAADLTGDISARKQDGRTDCYPSFLLHQSF